MTISAIRIEGGLLGPDIFEQLLAGDLRGQRVGDFGLDSKRNLTDEIAAAFSDARALWGVFQHRLQRLPDTDIATSVTRDAWAIPFLGLLGYEPRYNPRAYDVDGLSFAISHRAGEAEDSPPVHIVGARQELGRVPASGRPRLAPHSLVQEYLNRTEHLWGIVTNGRMLRLLRDSTFVRRQAYVEFDLSAMLEEQRFQDFAVLYRLLHRSRLPRGTADADQCLLEQYHQQSLEQGGRVRDRLRDGVEQCITRLANGFLGHPANNDLRRRIAPACTGNERITAEALYRQLLVLVYRFLFLLVSEDRGLLSSNPLYREHYSIGRLRRLPLLARRGLLDRRAAFTDHDDLWHSLRVLWLVLVKDQPQPALGNKPMAAALGLPVLNGQLFEPLDLDTWSITNQDLLAAFWHLAFYQESPSQPPRRVNYAALDVEELGSVYESLLDFHPLIDSAATPPRFELAFGSERKSTGSYYTPPQLVAELIRSALDPVIAERLAQCRTPEEKERALLSIRVCDPACGSGHFLLAAARRLGKELARIRTGEDEPAPERVREAIRDCVAHSIYGVDRNPLAVDLCRVALWLESHVADKPLTFLDHRIRCGDSLVGVFDPDVLAGGIPDEAFTPREGDDKTIANRLKAANRRERQDLRAGQLGLPLQPQGEIGDLAHQARQLDAVADDSPEAIRRKKELYESSRHGPQAARMRQACDLWTAAFFQPLRAGVSAITTAALAEHLAGRPVDPRVLGLAQTIAQRQECDSSLSLSESVGKPTHSEKNVNVYARRFFHWPLEFPEVFADGGFDVVMGNPPWERIKLQEEEFFATRDPKIATAANAAARKRLIRNLPETNPALWDQYRAALQAAESTSRFLRGSGEYPFTGRGDINTYSVFAERMRRLLKPGGRAGIIVPTGIATDETNKHFFAELVDSGSLVSLFDFENREGVFPHVHRSYKFSLLTMGKPSAPGHSAVAELAFFCTRAAHLQDGRRRFTLSPADIARLNPNTRTLPVFRTRQDAELTRAIYARVPVLVNEQRGENPWGVRFLRMFDMSNDSHLFRTAAQLEPKGFALSGNVFAPAGAGPVVAREAYVPLYEAKMIWHYDHRYGTYEGVAGRSSTHLPTPDQAWHADPAKCVRPWYWVPREEVEARLGDWNRGWLLGFRDVTNATNERTAIFSLLPRVGVGNKIPLWLFERLNPVLQSCLLACTCSVPFDFVARQKIGGATMNFFYVKQFPVLPPSAYTADDLLFIVPRVLELVYTAWDLKAFADDVWRDADEALRAAIRAQWDQNAGQAGGHRWQPPDWLRAYPEIAVDPNQGIPLPPFKWDEQRRAWLRAELDARYARLYGLTRKQLRYILDPADLTQRELENILDPWEEIDDPLESDSELSHSRYAQRVEKSDFPGETFRVLKEKELRQYGEYRTRRLVLEAWSATRNR